MNVQIKNARLSFPSLFKATSFEKGGDTKFSAAFILDKKANADDLKKLKSAVEAVLLEKYGKAVPKGFKKLLRDGSEKETDGYGADVMFFSASSQKRIPVVDMDFTPLDGSEGKPYAGCYVNVSVRLWVQDNDFGKRVNAALRAVRFVRDGETFGEKAMTDEDVQAELGDDIF